jgi:hypothetical protein
VLSRIKLFRSYSNDEMDRIFDKLLDSLRRYAINPLSHSAKEPSPYDLEEAAFAVATDLVLADGLLTQQE